jgi:hypothetical protein
MSNFAFGNPVLCIPEEYKALKIEAQFLEEDFVTLHRMDLQSISYCPQRVLEAQRFMLLYISLYIVHFGSYCLLGPHKIQKKFHFLGNMLYFLCRAYPMNLRRTMK